VRLALAKAIEPRWLSLEEGGGEGKKKKENKKFKNIKYYSKLSTLALIMPR